jgi:hypothetical protein
MGRHHEFTNEKVCEILTSLELTDVDGDSDKLRDVTWIKFMILEL